MLGDYLAIAFRNLSQRKLRSWLTVLGIVIGITSIVALIATAQGLENAITEQFEAFGANRVYVLSAGVGDPSQLQGLTSDDVKVVEQIPEVDYAAAYLIEPAILEFGREKIKHRAIGWPAELTQDLFNDWDIDFIEGREFTANTNEAVIGYLAATDLFDKEIRINNRIEIEGKKFKVVGVLEKIGNPEDDNQVYIPLDKLREIFDKDDEVSAIDIKVKEGRDPNFVATKVERRLEKARDDDDFSVSTPDQLLEQLGTILVIINIVLVGIAAISLVVGAVGIMNSMYTSVIERTKEIGIMKSIGATNANILTVFLLESGIMGLVGGIIGVALGTSIAKGVQFAASSVGFELLRVKVSIPLTLGGITFALIVGMLAGALPAMQAAKLTPVLALRKQ